MNFWFGKKVLVTGGAGFLGRQVVDVLLDRGVDPDNILVPRRKDCDLRIRENCQKAVDGTDIVIHLAAHVGGIGLNLEKPAEMFYDNASMNILLMEEAYRAGVEKFVGAGSVCSYPKFTPAPFKESSIWDGYPEESNAPYGIAKKLLLVQSQAYRQQYGFNAITLFLVNLYGPGDNLDPGSGHVVPALIKKVYDAKHSDAEFFEVWGTGRAIRELLYVKDAALGIVMAAERYNKPEPINLGNGRAVAISDLARLIAHLLDFNGSIRWNSEKPDGQLMRYLDVSRARAEFGFMAPTDLEEGLRQTIGWYCVLRETGRINLEKD